MTLRALLVDDEPLAVERLADLLTRVGGVEVAGTAGTGEAALERIAEIAPDLILLDVEMPLLDGFDVIEALRARAGDAGPPPLVIFVTAYPAFAAQAFDTGAVDFLTKPVRLGRLEQAIARAEAARDAREAADRLVQLEATLDQLRAARNDPPEDRALWLRRAGELVRIDPRTIEWVQAEGEYVRLHAGGRDYLHRELIGNFANQLDAALFVRVHRSFIVRRDYVHAVLRTRWGGQRLRIVSGEEIPIGRKYAKDAATIFERASVYNGVHPTK